MRRGYREGDWFAVPLGDGRFVAGIISAGSRNALSGYFFQPAGQELPDLANLVRLRPSTALWSGRFFDGGLDQARWPVVGAHPNFERGAWPKLDDEPLEPRCVESFLVRRLAGEPANRPHLAVLDLRTPIDARRLRQLPQDARVYLQWRSPLSVGEIDFIERSTATMQHVTLRLYGDAHVQLAHVARWAHLDRLVLDGARLPGAPAFPHVRDLGLDGAPVDFAAVPFQFPRLRRLRINARGARLNVDAVARLAPLERLEIAGADCAGTAALKALAALRSLEFRETQLDDAAALLRLPGLRDLRLQSIPGLRSIEALRAHSNVRRLALESLTHVDDVSVLATLPKLESLELTGMWQFRVEDVSFIASLPGLLRLKLDIGGRRKNLEIYRRRPLAEPLPFGVTPS